MQSEEHEKKLRLERAPRARVTHYKELPWAHHYKELPIIRPWVMNYGIMGYWERGDVLPYQLMEKVITLAYYEQKRNLRLLKAMSMEKRSYWYQKKLFMM